ncbi:MAG: hypothetical protein IPH24_04380 [Crocinitomicaceae bacterium]|nr:hypothetical protein [Crocinitomicaceae bacterium]
MKLLFASRYFLSKFAAVVAVLFLLSSSFNGFAQNPTVINDSLVVNNRVYAKEKLIVDKEAKFKEDIKVLGTARLVGDLIVSGTAKFNGNVKMENLGITALTDSSEIIVILPNGQLKKGNLGNILQESLPPADLDYCGAEGGIPKWWAGTNKLFTGCDETNVGIATYHPLHKLHVVGVNYARSFLAGNVNATTAALVNGYATNNSQTLINLGVKIGTGAEDVRFTITNKGEIKATNIGTGPTLTINNGTGHALVAYANDGTKILQLQNDGKLYSRGVIVNLNTWADYVLNQAMN